MKCHLLCQPVLLTLPQTKLSSRLLLFIRLICLLLPTLQQIHFVGATITQLDSHAISGDNNDTSSIWATDSTLWQIKPKPGYSISKREVEKSSEKASGNLNEFDPTLWTQSNQEHSSSHLHRHKRRRHRRRLPLGVIGKVIAKLTGRAKVAPAAAAADKMDDVLAVGGKLGKGGLGRGPSRGLPRRQQNRQVDPPSLNPYTLPRDEVARARSKALTGANLALATGGVAAGVWYFSGENSTLFAVLLGIALISLAVAVAVFCYCLLCRRRKRGYYAVNDDILMAFVKKLLFYMF